MANHYADAIDVIARELTLRQLKAVAVDYAKRHPKAFVDAAFAANNDAAVKARQRTTENRAREDQ